MTNVYEYYAFYGDNFTGITFDDNNEAQVEEGVTVYVSIAAMDDCKILGTLQLNDSPDGVITIDDGYYSFAMPAADATFNVTSSDSTEYELIMTGTDHVSFENLLVGNDSDPVSPVGDVYTRPRSPRPTVRTSLRTAR